MPICRKCNVVFPNRMSVNGKTKNVQHRKYCFTCSPFGMHNTRQLHGRLAFEPIEAPELECTLCERRYIFDRRKGHRLKMCNSCNANAQRRKRKTRAVIYKGTRCCHCGYNKCLRALEFHHRDRDGKEFSIASMMSMSWDRVKQELDKCDLVCSNCHREEEDRIANCADSLVSNRRGRTVKSEVLGLLSRSTATEKPE